MGFIINRMEKSLKKKVAKEVLIFFGLLGITILTVLGILTYKFIIDKKVANLTMEINSEKRIVAGLEEEFQSVKVFIEFLKKMEDENRGSNYSLYLASKDLYIEDAIKIYEDQKSINGEFPNPQDTISYIECIRQICTGDKWSKYLVYSDNDIISVWNCLSTKVDNLYYLLPMKVLEEFGIKNKSEMINFFTQNSLNKDDINYKIKKAESETNIKQLEKNLYFFDNKSITKEKLIRYSKTIFAFFIILTYPIRLLILTFKWAIKTYRQ